MTIPPPHPAPDAPATVPVAIIGAGPPGVSVAALLARDGLDVTVIERNPAPVEIPRAIVIDDEGLRMLQSLGLSEPARAFTRTADGACYYDEARRLFAETGRGAEDFGFPKRNYLHQPDLEALLLAHLRTHPRVTLRFATEAVLVEPGGKGDCALLRLSGGGSGGEDLLRARWVLACDGGRSPMRAALGIAMEGQTYGQDWIVLDLARDPDQEPVSRFYCDAGRPQVSIPAPRGGGVTSSWSCPARRVPSC
ncbi:MAG: FAD-dependent monooxygenase [Rhodobacteraceae bacterium]|nr:FAD-dependent monooxygenase [Paracoccaceae bacterium]